MLRPRRAVGAVQDGQQGLLPRTLDRPESVVGDDPRAWQARRRYADQAALETPSAKRQKDARTSGGKPEIPAAMRLSALPVLNRSRPSLRARRQSPAGSDPLVLSRHPRCDSATSRPASQRRRPLGERRTRLLLIRRSVRRRCRVRSRGRALAQPDDREPCGTFCELRDGVLPEEHEREPPPGCAPEPETCRDEHSGVGEPGERRGEQRGRRDLGARLPPAPLRQPAARSAGRGRSRWPGSRRREAASAARASARGRRADDLPRGRRSRPSRARASRAEPRGRARTPRLRPRLPARGRSPSGRRDRAARRAR